MVLVLIRLLFVYVGSFTLKPFFFFFFFFFSLSFLPECRYIRSYSYTYLYIPYRCFKSKNQARLSYVVIVAEEIVSILY